MLDADVIIRGEKGTFDLATWMSHHGTEGFEVAAITVAELWHGVERASAEHRAQREQYIRAVLEELPVIPRRHRRMPDFKWSKGIKKRPTTSCGFA